MPMKDLKISEMEKKDRGESSILADTPDYPYGLKINLDADVVDKMEMGDVPKVGDVFTMLARVEVVDVSKSGKSEGDVDKHSIGLQITDMALDKGKEDKAKEAGEVLYGDS